MGHRDTFPFPRAAEQEALLGPRKSLLKDIRLVVREIAEVGAGGRERSQKLRHLVKDPAVGGKNPEELVIPQSSGAQLAIRPICKLDGPIGKLIDGIFDVMHQVQKLLLHHHHRFLQVQLLDHGLECVDAAQHFLAALVPGLPEAIAHPVPSVLHHVGHAMGGLLAAAGEAGARGGHVLLPIAFHALRELVSQDIRALQKPHRQPAGQGLQATLRHRAGVGHITRSRHGAGVRDLTTLGHLLPATGHVDILLGLADLCE
mmetsp:Transcript_98865/g.235750  ORF Transcript_98865/g.235750 Transcript_98865/m.235750 type:complete len:259 (+) Transcript_98865:1059-1835(+)